MEKCQNPQLNGEGGGGVPWVQIMENKFSRRTSSGSLGKSQGMG